MSHEYLKQVIDSKDFFRSDEECLIEQNGTGLGAVSAALAGFHSKFRYVFSVIGYDSKRSAIFESFIQTGSMIADLNTAGKD